MNSRAAKHKRSCGNEEGPLSFMEWRERKNIMGKLVFKTWRLEREDVSLMEVGRDPRWGSREGKEKLAGP